MIIGISGKIKSGKDTLAGMIMEQQPNYAWQIKKNSWKLKVIAGILLGVDPKKFESQEFKTKKLGKEWDYMTVRKFLQLLGTEAVRQGLHTNSWVNALYADYTDDQNWLITDVRFPNEADAVKQRSGFLVRIERDGMDTGDHPSEVALDDYDKWDFVIHNNYDLEHLENEASRIINMITPATII